MWTCTHVIPCIMLIWTLKAIYSPRPTVDPYYVHEIYFFCTYSVSWIDNSFVVYIVFVVCTVSSSSFVITFSAFDSRDWMRKINSKNRPLFRILTIDIVSLMQCEQIHFFFHSSFWCQFICSCGEIFGLVTKT